jgi:hypothetical protein
MKRSLLIGGPFAGREIEYRDWTTVLQVPERHWDEFRFRSGNMEDIWDLKKMVRIHVYEWFEAELNGPGVNIRVVVLKHQSMSKEDATRAAVGMAIADCLVSSSTAKTEATKP